jgi:hypothetical protein
MNRSLILFCLLCVVAVAAGAHVYFYEPKFTMDTIAVEEAPRFHALIFRYDTEISTPEQLQRLLEQDEKLGIRASAFPLTHDFRTRRNVLFEYSQRAGEVQLHARAMPQALTNAFIIGGDPTPYQFGHLDQDQMIGAYFHNLIPEIAIFEFNGFYPEGTSLHAAANRLPWDDDVNYRIIGAAAARAGLRWVSVTSQAFSIGPDRANPDPLRFNDYDRVLTSRQPSQWVSARTDWRTRHSTLVIPTSWRDKYWTDSLDPQVVRDMYARMLEDIDRHWQAAKEDNLALVLLFHPSKYIGKPLHDERFLDIRRTLIERARGEAVPVMTFSDYTARLASMR